MEWDEWMVIKNLYYAKNTYGANNYTLFTCMTRLPLISTYLGIKGRYQPSRRERVCTISSLGILQLLLKIGLLVLLKNYWIFGATLVICTGHMS